MQILWLSGREITYPRNDVLLRALQRFVSVDVVDPVLKKPRSLFWRSISITLQSIPYLITKPYDLIVVGFYGHLIMVLNPVRERRVSATTTAVKRVIFGASLGDMLGLKISEA